MESRLVHHGVGFRFLGCFGSSRVLSGEGRGGDRKEVREKEREREREKKCVRRMNKIVRIQGRCCMIL